MEGAKDVLPVCFFARRRQHTAQTSKKEKPLSYLSASEPSDR
jgi:hypothetical protein